MTRRIALLWMQYGGNDLERYMKPSDILVVSLGVLAIFIAFVADSFGPVPRRYARTCLILLGLAAISSVVWHRILNGYQIVNPPF
jgi:hypothetical protein